jgi:glutamine amidotransferase
MIGIIDYGMGNLRSVENALKKLGIPSVISSDPAVLNICEKLILPGVGAFGDCMANITSRGLDVFIRQSVNEGKPLLGICLGMQMLFEESEENGLTKGFGFLKGRVIRMETDLPVPEIGWNELEFNHETALRSLLSEHPYVYYVHSYYASDYDDADLIGYSMYGEIRVPGLVMRNSVMGTQFHPEKSADDGLKILAYFAKEFS